jgi:hypothetical protein
LLQFFPVESSLPVPSHLLSYYLVGHTSSHISKKKAIASNMPG